MIVFRNDMIFDPKDIKSVAELHDTDMAMPSLIEKKIISRAWNCRKWCRTSN
jgi:hypothetical protein